MQSSPLLSEKNPKNSWHEYDLDALGIVSSFDSLEYSYHELLPSSLTKPELFDATSIQLLKYYCEEEKINLDFHISNKVPLVISSTHNFYHIFLERLLCYYDINKIDSFLCYQYDNFAGNYYAKVKSEFVGLVYFIVYKWIKEFHPVNPALVLQKISDWKNTVLLFIPKVIEPDMFISIHNMKDRNKAIKFLTNYFSSKDILLLKKLLIGEPILGKIKFLGDADILIDTFNRMKILMNCNQVTLKRWLCNFFEYGKVAEQSKPITKDYADKKFKPSNPCLNPIPEFVDWLPTHGEKNHLRIKRKNLKIS